MTQTQPDEREREMAEEITEVIIEHSGISYHTRNGETEAEIDQGHVRKVCPEKIAQLLHSYGQEMRLEGERAGAEREREKWVTLLGEHKKHCSSAGQRHLTEVKNTIIGKHPIKRKLLFETLAEAVRAEVPFPGETNDGRCPKCDEKVPCANCIANVEPQEAQEQIEAARQAVGEGKE